MEPSAIDLFKEMHCSKKKGFSEAVQKAIVSTCFLSLLPVSNMNSNILSFNIYVRVIWKQWWQHQLKMDSMCCL
jgi:hypothetical protein